MPPSRLTDMTQRAIGGYYGGITSAAVGNIRRRLRHGDYPLQEVIEQLLGEASLARRRPVLEPKHCRCHADPRLRPRDGMPPSHP